MNKEEAMKTLEAIESLAELDAGQIISEGFANDPDLPKVKIEGFYAIDLIDDVNNVVATGRKAFSSDRAGYMPEIIMESFHDSWGDIKFHNLSVAEVIEKVESYLKAANWESFTQNLAYVVRYFKQNDVWPSLATAGVNQPARKRDIDALFDRVTKIAAHLEKNVEAQKAAIEEGTRFLKEKEERFQSLDTNTKKSRELLQELNNLLQSGTGIETRLSSVLEKLMAQHGEAVKHIRSIGSIKNQAEKISVSLSQNDGRYNQLLQFSQEKKKEFDERLKQLDEVLGLSSAEALFNTFDKRKKELEAPVKQWKWIVLSTGIATLVMILAIFSNFFGLLGKATEPVGWEHLLLNSLKSVPLIILLYFTIRQYIRERGFQEEYAFRSAVALTVQGYARLFEGDERERMLSDAVQKIYASPRVLREKRWGLQLRNTETRKLLEEMSSTLQRIVVKGTQDNG